MSLKVHDLEKVVQHHFPAANDRLQLTPITTGKFNSSYWVQAGDEELVLRIAPPDDAVFVFNDNIRS